MMYLSKGIVQKNSTEQLLFVAHCGRTFELTGIDSALWQNGRYGFSEPQGGMEDRALEHLARMGLAETEPEDSAEGRYRILCRCICCPAKFTSPERPMTKREKQVLLWLRGAGLRLTTAELVYLLEHNIQPEEGLLYQENRQALVETIYTKDTIADNLLERQMESAACRDEVVGVLMKLLKKKKILLL